MSNLQEDLSFKEPIVNRRSPDEPVADLETQDNKKSPGFRELYSSQRDEIQVLQNLFRLSKRDPVVDTNFVDTISLEKIQKDAEYSGVTLTDPIIEFVSGASNPTEYNWRLYRAKEMSDNNQLLSEAGGMKVFAASMAAAATDPSGFLLDAATGGSTKVGLMKRFLESGSKAAAADLVVEAIRVSDGEGVDPMDFTAGLVTSFAIGGAIGTKGNKNTVRLEELEQAHKLREDILDYKAATSSVGAAENPYLPGNLFGDSSSDITDELIERIEVEGLSNPKYQKIRMDMSSSAQKSNDVTVRKAMDDFIGVGVQEKGVARQVPIEQESLRLRDTFNKEWNESFVANFVAHEKKRNKGILRRQFDHDEADKFNRAVGRYMHGLDDDASDEVKAAAEAAWKNFENVKKYAIDSGRMAPEDFLSTGKYLPLRFKNGAIERIAGRVGLKKPQQLRPLFVKAIKDGRNKMGLEVDDRLTEVVADAYLYRALGTGKPGKFGDDLAQIDLNDSNALIDMIDEFLPDDMKQSAKDAILSNTGKKKIQNGDSPDPMKGRIVMDRDAVMEINGVPVSMKELFEDDISRLIAGYNNTMSGELALRARGWTGRKVEKFITEKSRSAAANKGHKDAFGEESIVNPTEADVRNLQFALDRILHRGVTTGNDTADALFRISGNHAFSKMAGAGLNAISESGAAIAQTGLRNFVKNYPEMRKFMKAVKSGDFGSDKLADMSTMMGGAASRFMEGRAKYNIQDDLIMEQGARLGKLDRAMDGTRRIIDAASGLSYLTDQTTMIAHYGNANHLMNFGLGKKMPKWFKNRAKAWGMTPDKEALIKKHMTSDQVRLDSNGGVADLGAMSFETREAFESVLFAMNTNAIQRVFSGNLPKWMQNPYGSFIMKFRSFVTAAWVKHTLEDINQRDFLAATKLMLTGGLGMLTYIARQAMTYPTNPDKLEEKLTMDNVLRSGATYAVNASLLPTIVDTVTESLLGAPLIDKQRTSGYSSSFGGNLQEFVANIPGITMASDVIKTGQAAATILRGGELSQSDWRAIFSASMVDTFYGTRAFRAAVVNNAPSDRKADKNVINLKEEAQDLFN